MAMQALAPVDFFSGALLAGDLSGATSADEGRVRVIHLEGGSRGAGRGIPRANRVAIGAKFYFADQLSTPGLVDAGANLALHAFKLALPRLSIRGQFQASVLAAEQAGMVGEGFANDGGPSA